MGEIFIFISRTKTPYIESRVRNMLNLGIEAYAVIDELDKPSKRFITYTDEFMEEKGWTHHMSRPQHRITAWDKATYFAHQSKAEYVWFCEDDVFWNKGIVIKSLIEHAQHSNSDLIAYPLADTYEINPKWWHWSKSEMITKNKKNWSATYNQLCRVSRRLLDDIAKLSQERKRLYFHETMFPTICKMKKYPILYYNELDLPIHIVVRWDKPFTKEQVEELIKTHKYVLLHPVKFLL